MSKYCIIGSDNRTNYLRVLYAMGGKKLVAYHENPDYIITPIPFSRDDVYVNGETIKCDDLIEKCKGKVIFTGVLSKELETKMQGSQYYDLMKLDEVAVLNAIPTAEGAILEAFRNSDITLSGSNCLVMGYGRVGKVLAKMLNGIGCHVSCEARSKKDLAYIHAMGYHDIALEKLEEVLPKFDYIFNTVPVKLLDEKRLNLLKKECLIVDLASNPGGVEYEKAKEIGIKVVWALSLPGKVAPKAAAIYLKDTIDAIIASM